MGEIYHSLAMMYYIYYKNDWNLIVKEAHERMEREKRELQGVSNDEGPSCNEMQIIVN